MKYLSVIVLLFISFQSLSQEKKLKAYIDCRCDENYLKQETSFLEYVRDQDLADIEIFVRDVRNPTGSRSFEIKIDGNNDYKEISSSAVAVGYANDTSSTLRDKLLNKIKLALVPFLDKGNYNLKVDIDSNFEDLSTNDDKWKNWVFELSGSYNNDKEESRQTNRYEIEFEIDKLTEDWRIGMELRRNESNRKFFSDDDVYISNRKTTSFNGRAVRSISDHFSAGAFFGLYQNTYENVDLNRYIAPAIEYSFYPYYEFVRREMVINYRIGYGYRNYIEETIYNKMEENVYLHQLAFETRFRQPWGEIYTNLRGKAFLHDPSKNSLRLDSWFSIRVFEGLSVKFGGEIELIRDQLSLPKGNASIEDLLLQQQEIATDFRSEFRIAIGYTFGSAFNNYLNSRL